VWVHGHGSGGPPVVLVAEVTRGDVAVRVVVDVERQVALRADLEAGSEPPVGPADGQLVSPRTPAQRHLEAVVGATGQFPGLWISLAQPRGGFLPGETVYRSG
jgi:hypothetical protein